MLANHGLMVVLMGPQMPRCVPVVTQCDCAVVDRHALDLVRDERAVAGCAPQAARQIRSTVRPAALAEDDRSNRTHGRGHHRGGR